ncbi:MAG: hypothetical protein ABIH20_01145 [Candidatus Diapherotrites archaeon]
MKKTILILALILFFGSFVVSQTEDSNIEIIKPSETRIEKNNELEFEVKINTASSNTIERVYVEFHGLDLEQIELTKNENGNYEGSVFIDYKTGGMGGGFEIVADISTDSGELMDLRKSPRIQIEQAEITFDFELIPSVPYYLNSKIEKVKLNAFYPDGTRLTADDLEEVEFSIGGERPKLEFKDDPESDSLIADLDFELTLESGMEENQDIVYEIEIDRLEDKYNNYGNLRLNEFLRIKNEHPDLKIRVKDFDEYIQALGGSNFKFNIAITGSPELKNERVYLLNHNKDIEDEEIECKKLLQEKEKIDFLCKITLPSSDEKSKLMLTIIAEADFEGKKIVSFKTMQIEIGYLIFIELVNPDLEGRGFSQELDKIKAKFLTVRDSDQQIESQEIAGTVNGKEVTFIWNPKEEVFEAEYDLTQLFEQEEQVLEISLSEFETDREIFDVYLEEPGDFGNFGGQTDQGFPIELIGIIIILVVILIAPIYFIALKKKKEETTTELQDKAKRLKNLLKRIEYEYYKRHLTEEEFKTRSLEYQAELDEVIVKLKMKKETQK